VLLSQDNQTVIPKIVSFLGSTQKQGDVMYAVAAVVWATVLPFLQIMFFQRQIVSGLTAGAVKGQTLFQAEKQRVLAFQTDSDPAHEPEISTATLAQVTSDFHLSPGRIWCSRVLRPSGLAVGCPALGRG